MIIAQKSDDTLTRFFLSILRLAVFTDSSFLVMTLLSLYGLIRGIVRVPRKRVSAIKSLLRYGVNVIQRALSSQTRSTV
jgi:hypothetical protein